MTRNARRLAATIALFNGATTQGEAAAAAAAITRIETAHPDLVDADGHSGLVALEIDSAKHYTNRSRWMTDATEEMSEHTAAWTWSQAHPA